MLTAQASTACWSARSRREHMESLGHPHPPAHFTGEETEASTVAPQQILGTPPPPLPPSWTHPQGRQGADLVHGQRRLLVVLSRGAELQEGVVDAKKRGVMNWGVGAAQAPPCWAVFGGRELRIEQHQKDCNKSFHPSRHIPEAPVRPARWGMGSAKNEPGVKEGAWNVLYKCQSEGGRARRDFCCHSVQSLLHRWGNQ